MSGFGNMPFGTGPFGLGTPTTGTAPPSGQAGSRFINPSTRSFEIDANTRQLKQMPGTRQRVLLALNTLFGSSTVDPKLGLKLPRQLGSNYQSTVTNAVTLALAHLWDTSKVIKIQQIQVTKSRFLGRVDILVQYIDLESGLEDQAETTVG